MSDEYLRKMSLSEFHKQYEGTFAEPEPMTEDELLQMERRHERRDDDAQRVIREVWRLRGLLAAAEQRATESDARIRAYETFIRWLGESWKTGFTYMQDAAAREHVERHGPFASREDGARWRSAWSDAQIQRYVKPAMDALTAPATQPDERAAKERAIIAAGRVIRLHCEAVPSCNPSGLDDLKRALDALDATDGAAKETT